jgi:hypothetical protein
MLLATANEFLSECLFRPLQAEVQWTETVELAC